MGCIGVRSSCVTTLINSCCALSWIFNRSFADDNCSFALSSSFALLLLLHLELLDFARNTIKIAIGTSGTSNLMRTSLPFLQKEHH